MAISRLAAEVHLPSCSALLLSCPRLHGRSGLSPDRLATLGRLWCLVLPRMLTLCKSDHT